MKLWLNQFIFFVISVCFFGHAFADPDYSQNDYKLGISEPTYVERRPILLRGEIDRRFLFEYALNSLSYYLFHFQYTGLLQQMSAEDIMTFENLFRIAESQNKVREQNKAYQIREDERLSYDFRMYFSRNQKRFILNPGEPVRTGVNYKGNRSDFYINLAIINDPKIRISLDQAVQIIIHEVGHKIPDKNQDSVDRIATMVARFIKSKTKTTRLSDGSAIHFLSGFEYKPFEIKDHQLMNRSFVVWRESDNQLVDLTAEVQKTFYNRLNQLRPNQNQAIHMEKLHDFPYSDNLQFYFKQLNIRDIDEVASQKIRIQYDMHEKLDRIDRISLRSLRFQTLPNSISNVQASGSVVLNWKSNFAEVSKVHFEKEYKLITDSVAEIIDLKESTEEVRIIARLSKELAEGVKTLDLVLQVNKEHVNVQGKRNEENSELFEFVVRWSEQTHVHFARMDSFIINQKHKIYADQGFQIRLNTNNNRMNKVRLNKIMIETPIGPVDITKIPLVNKMDFNVQMVFESNTPIHQIGIVWNRLLDTIDPKENYYNEGVLQREDMANGKIWPHGHTKYFGQKKQVEVEYYNQSQFTQKRIGNRIIVELPIQHRQLVQTESPMHFTHRVSRFYKEEFRAGKVIAVETFSKQLVQIDVVNESFEKTTVVPEKKWTVEYNQSANKIMKDSSYWMSLSNEQKMDAIFDFERKERYQDYADRYENTDLSLLDDDLFSTKEKPSKMKPKLCQSIFVQK